MFKKKCRIKSILFFFSITVFFYSCFEKKSDTQVNLKANLNTIPTQEMFNSQIIRTDSGRAVMQIKAPVIQFFDFDKKKSYTLLPRGGEVKKYNTKNGKAVYIRSDWAKIDDKKGLYEGKGNVIIISESGDTIKTNHIFWNRLQQKVYNDVKTYIIRPNRDSLIAKKGLEADDQFKNVNLRGTETITKNAQLK